MQKYKYGGKQKMKVHYLKTIPKYFWEAARGNKPFEVRKND